MDRHRIYLRRRRSQNNQNMTFYNWLLNNLFKITTAICVISCIVLTIIKVVFSLSYLPDISGSETTTIFPIQFNSGESPMYSDPETAPFRFTQYTPIYLVIATFFFELTGWLPTDVHKVFVVNRFLSIGFTFLTVFMVAFVLTKVSGRKLVVGVLSACVVFQILSFWILTSSRPDSLIVLLTASYVGAVYKATTSRKGDLWFILAIFIAVSAFFVKQSGTIHALALAGFCIYQNQWKLLMKITLAGICFFGMYLLILPTESMSVFFDNIVGGVKNSISWDWFYDWTLERFLFQFAPLIACNFIISIYSLANDRSDLYRFLAISSILFFVFATATAFKIGAGVGYYQDYMILVVMQTALFFTEPVRISWFAPGFLKALVACYFSIVSIHCTLYIYTTYSNQPIELYTHQYSKEKVVADYIVKEKKLARNEWVYVSHADHFQGLYLKHFLFKNILIPFPDIVYLANKNGTFNFKKFGDMVKNNEIRFVVTKKGNAPENILGYKFPSLRKVKTIEEYDIYEN